MIVVMVFSTLACSATFEVLNTPQASPWEAVQTNTPSEDLLPKSFYYLAGDQVMSIARDGKTSRQLTFEPLAVTEFNVSLTDGKIAYVSGGQLYLVNEDGSGRKSVAEEGRSPVFSPDGRTLAFSLNGLNMYDLSSEQTTLILEDQPLGESPSPEIFIPDSFSPDGTKLLLKIGHPPDNPWTSGIYSFTTNSVLRYGEEEGSLSCCTAYGGAEWSPDSSSVYAVATLLDSSFPFGELWQIDSATGVVTTLIPGYAGEGDTSLNYLAYKPHLTLDGDLYFFSAKYAEAAGYFRRAPLIMVRSTPEDINTNWSVLRSETFNLMNEALWAPDGSLAVVVIAPSEDVFNGGEAVIVYTDGRPNMILASFSQQIQWGP